MITYSYNKELGIIKTICPAILKTAMVPDHFQRIADDTTIANGATEEVHFENTEDIEFTFADSIKISEAYEKLVSSGKITKTIFIIHNKYQRGIATMLQTVLPNHDNIQVKQI